MGHTNFVGAPIKKKRHDTGHPKCLVCALADVPAGAPLLKVYTYGSFGTRFFLGPPSLRLALRRNRYWRKTRSILYGEPPTLTTELAQ